jgi:growth factor-regulated tyrosine kinase substrate
MNIDALLDLHAKLSTVVRYYDRMLEERLSNTYNQHTIGGYNLPPQRPTSTMYPSISSNIPNGPGGAESFYTGNAQQEPYGRPQLTYSYGPPQQQYQQYNKRASVASPGYPATEQRSESYNTHPTQQQPHQQPPQPQRSGSWKAADSSSAPYPLQAPVYPPENTPQQLAQPINAPSQPPSNYTPSEPAMTPSADPNAVFYYNHAGQAPPLQKVPEQSQPQYPPMQSPNQYHSTIPQPQSTSPQQFTRQPVQPQEHQPPPQQQQHQNPPYWQAQQQNSAAPQAWQAPNSTYNGYTQESFPSAPHHAPQPKVVEESLIDL